MLGVLRSVFNANEREVRRLQRVVRQCNAWEPEVSALSDDALRARTVAFRERLDRGESLDDLLPEAFAVAREAAQRVLGMRPFDVQLMGGVVLHEGRIAEMKTGEGKTLVATLPAYLNALTGRGVHIVTVNDYLARRDSQWMGQIFRFLGLRVGLIVHEFDAETRKRNYAADVVYGTNQEFGFDYLRDNMALDAAELTQRELHYAIVDEVDSILIDEARTPLIISDMVPKPTEAYYRFAKLAETLEPERDYTVDEKLKTVAVTEEGVHRVERALGIANLFDVQHMNLSHYLENALKAKALFHRDREYIVKDGEVVLVDEFTGRLMFGRRYSHGLHEAIEAKENVRIAQGSQTVATITFQNYFRLYEKLAGMTGTAATEEEEFHKIYKLDVVVIPTHLPMIRRDYPDVIYKTEAAKFRAVVAEIKDAHARRQPVLVGTVDIAKSERLSALLDREGVPHQVLNAKHHEKEAQIIAQAGRAGAVTIATNMAGRGTDILLGGNPEYLARQRLVQEGVSAALVALASEKVPPPLPPAGTPPEAAAGVAAESAPAEGAATTPLDPELLAELAAVGQALPSPEELGALRARYLELVDAFRKETEAEHEVVVAAGGLHVIGTERHESRRIDNQLRGRAGRQGDPGSSRFYLSLEDDLMRLFGSERLRGLMDRLGVEEDEPIESALVSRAIETAQRRVEANNFEARKHVLEYDDVLNQQREVIYAQRRRTLEEADVHPIVEQMLEDVCQGLVEAHCPAHSDPEDWNLAGLVQAAEQAFLPAGTAASSLRGLAPEEIVQRFLEAARGAYASLVETVGLEPVRAYERQVVLRTVNHHWMEHLDAMDDLREGIHLRAYGQLDPLSQYRIEAFEMFEDMIQQIRGDVVRLVYKVTVVRLTPEQEAELERQREMARHAVVAEMAGLGAAAVPPAQVLPITPPRVPAAPAEAVPPAVGGEGGTAAAAAAAALPELPPAVRGGPAGGGRRAVPKVGRNEPCPCGSGKKYKHCHGR
jgi:preprotein translocase subunit SecA